jgi:hypothetical protein
MDVTLFHSGLLRSPPSAGKAGAKKVDGIAKARWAVLDGEPPVRLVERVQPLTDARTADARV